MLFVNKTAFIKVLVGHVTLQGIDSIYFGCTGKYIDIKIKQNKSLKRGKCKGGIWQRNVEELMKNMISFIHRHLSNESETH